MLFNNDDTLLTTVGLDGVCRLWEPASGRLLITGARGHGIAFSPDGERIAFERPGKSVGMWKLERGTGFRSLTVRSDSATQLRGLTLSPDGRWLVAASDRGVHIWDLPANAGSRFIARANLWAIDFAPDGNSLLMTSATNVVQCQFSALLPATAGDLPVAEVFRFPQEISVFCVAFSPDLQRAVVAAADTRAAILDRPPRDELTWLTKAPAVRYPSGVANLPGARTVAFSPDGRWVAHGEYEGGPGIWDAATGKLVRHLKGVNGTVRFDDDGRRLLVGSYDEYQWWDLQDPAQAYPISREGDGATLGVSAIDQAHHCLATVRFNQSIRLSSLSNQTEYASFAMPDPQTLNGLSFGAQGTLLIAPTRRDSIYVWNIPELRRGLSALNLDWDIAAAGNGAEASASRPAAHLAPSSKGGFGAQTFVLGLMGVAGTGVAGFLGLLVLRRHQWLAREFLQAEELVLTRERELRVEQEISRVKGHFVSMVSHEFRTPLGVISSSAEILRRYFDRLTEEGRREHLADITESVGRMKDLMEGHSPRPR
ncbi:MAG: histidine kinase dimerization/phospho-acceptor domain-containing protein [Verrucomicrobiota bacterium]